MSLTRFGECFATRIHCLRSLAPVTPSFTTQNITGHDLIPDILAAYLQFANTDLQVYSLVCRPYPCVYQEIQEMAMFYSAVLSNKKKRRSRARRAYEEVAPFCVSLNNLINPLSTFVVLWLWMVCVSSFVISRNFACSLLLLDSSKEKNLGYPSRLAQVILGFIISRNPHPPLWRGKFSRMLG